MNAAMYADGLVLYVGLDEAGKKIYHIEEIECITLTTVDVPP